MFILIFGPPAKTFSTSLGKLSRELSQQKSTLPGKRLQRENTFWMFTYFSIFSDFEQKDYGIYSKSFVKGLSELLSKWEEEGFEHFFGKSSKLGFFWTTSGKKISSKKPSAGLSQVLSACRDQRVKMNLNFREKESKNKFRFWAKHFQTLSINFVSFV